MSLIRKFAALGTKEAYDRFIGDVVNPQNYFHITKDDELQKAEFVEYILLEGWERYRSLHEIFLLLTK